MSSPSPTSLAPRPSPLLRFPRPGRGFVGILLGVALLLLSATPEAHAEPKPGAVWESLRKETLERLHALATSATRAKLFRSRNEVFEGILRFDPDDKLARKFLKFRRAKDGSWERRGRYTPPRNGGKGLPEFETARTALGAWFAEQVEPLLEAAEDAEDARTLAAIRQAAVGVDPERASFRAWVGQVPDTLKEGRWILASTERARRRRPGIKAVAERALAAVPDPEPTTATDRDQRGNVAWTGLLQTERVRVVGMPDVAELAACAKNAEASWSVFEFAFDRRVGPIRGGGERRFTFYMFDTVDAGNAFLDAQPDMDEERKAFLRPLAACGLPRRPAVLVKTPDAAVRLEAAARQPHYSFLRSQLGLRQRNVWIKEAALLYLAYQVTGTRLISSVSQVQSDYAQPKAEQPEYESRLGESGANWYDLGLKLMESKDKPEIHLLPGKDFNQLTKFDVLYGWCILAYLVEGHPTKAADVLGALGSEAGTAVDSVFLDTLGFDTRTLEQRVMRWLEETRDL